jgi:hypothetical protein
MTDIVSGLILPSLQTREYTLGEKVNLWRGKLSSGVSALWSEVITTDLSDQLPAIDLPVYFLHGTFDYTVSYPITRAYYERLQAPLKGFYTFEHSAHSPMFEEPQLTLRILGEDVLRGTNGLADRPVLTKRLRPKKCAATQRPTSTAPTLAEVPVRDAAPAATDALGPGHVRHRLTLIGAPAQHFDVAL